jgi:hypothetical protein
MKTELIEAVRLLKRARQHDQAAQEARREAAWLLAACTERDICRAANLTGWTPTGLICLAKSVTGIHITD